MATATTPFGKRQEALKEQPVGFYQSHSDYGHIIVSRFRADESREVIGHIYSEVDGEEIRYISTNRKGMEIFVRTTDFNSVEKKFERYAHLLALQERTRAFYKNLLTKNNTVTLKNSNIMTTPNSTQPEQQQMKRNQLIFVEYEKAAGDGHFVTVVDSYRNVIGRIHKSYNDESKKYDYLAYDHAGNLMGTNEKLWELKKEFTNNREQLLEQAHQRRIASKQKPKEISKETPIEKPQQMEQTPKAQERKKETDVMRQDKNGKEKQHAKAPDKAVEKAPKKEVGRTTAKENVSANKEQSRQQEREEELTDLRNGQSDERGDMEMER